MATTLLHIRSGTRRRTGRWARVIRWAVALTSGLLLLVIGGLLLIVLLAPSVSNAQQRVDAILAAHNAPGDGGVVPTRVGTALLATEDSRYYHDPALDPRGVTRAVVGVVTSNGNDGGATIEQQLAKMLYAPGTGITAELKQVGMAFRLDQHFSKHTILAMYLDAAYFGDGAYGVTAAADHYFGVAPDQLSWAQATLLAGLVQAPTAYDPHGHLSEARARQSPVLARLVATHTFTPAEASQIFQSPLDPAISFYG
jgi:penicillin-binding protein 1A